MDNTSKMLLASRLLEYPDDVQSAYVKFTKSDLRKKAGLKTQPGP